MSRMHADALLDGDGWEKCSFTEPVRAEAEAYGESLKFMGGQANVLRTTLSDLGQMGVGIELYFRMSLYLGWLFILMTICALPALILNYEGHGMTASEKDAFGLAQFSLGNQVGIAFVHDL